MTTETVHPNHMYTLEEVAQRLQKLAHEPGEVALTMRVIIRDGVPRKWKFNVEDEPCPLNNAPRTGDANTPGKF